MLGGLGFYRCGSGGEEGNVGEEAASSWARTENTWELRLRGRARWERCHEPPPHQPPAGLYGSDLIVAVRWELGWVVGCPRSHIATDVVLHVELVHTHVPATCLLESGSRTVGSENQGAADDLTAVGKDPRRLAILSGKVR